MGGLRYRGEGISDAGELSFTSGLANQPPYDPAVENANKLRGGMSGLTWDASGDPHNFLLSNITLASMALFNVATMPTPQEMYAIVEWTKYQHMTAGNKVICPFFLWKDRA